MHKTLKEQSYEANMLLPKYQLVDMTFGNVSAIDRDAGIVAIKPSGVSYDVLTPADMVLIDLDGKRLEAGFNPSSDTPTHLELYKAFPTIGGVVHTHSRYATSFAQACMPVPCFGTTHADYFYGDIPLTRPLTKEEIEGWYEKETGAVIIERFRSLDPQSFPGVLVSCHGPFSWGGTAHKAVENAYAMEIISQMAYQTRLINPSIIPVPAPLLDKHFLRKHGKSAYYGQTRPLNPPQGDL
jgi:L-ribulose-5-phosphate 4-epimerase